MYFYTPASVIIKNRKKGYRTEKYICAVAFLCTRMRREIIQLKLPASDVQVGKVNLFYLIAQ